MGGRETQGMLNILCNSKGNSVVCICGNDIYMSVYPSLIKSFQQWQVSNK